MVARWIQSDSWACARSGTRPHRGSGAHQALPTLAEAAVQTSQRRGVLRTVQAGRLDDYIIQPVTAKARVAKAAAIRA